MVWNEPSFVWYTCIKMRMAFYDEVYDSLYTAYTVPLNPGLNDDRTGVRINCNA